ncbi:MAG: hypothetical protein ACM4D3_16130 [Candidatus Sericytochromatia bacterium]
MKWKLVGVALAVAAIGAAAPIAAAQPDNNNGQGNSGTHGNSGNAPGTHGNSGSAPGQAIAGVARSHAGPSAIISAIRESMPSAAWNGLSTALDNVPTSLPPTHATVSESPTG